MSSKYNKLKNDLEDNLNNKNYKISIEEKHTKANIRLGTKLIIYLIIAGISGAFFSNLLIKIRYSGVIKQFEENILENEMVITDYTEVLDIVSPSLVCISDKEDNLLSGKSDGKNWTGVILDEKGTIITNYSAVKELEEVYIRLNLEDVEILRAKVVVKNPENDLAMIKVEYNGKLTPIKFADENSIKIGQEIVVVGNTIGGKSASSVIPGVITSIGSYVGVNDKEISLMQTNAPINQGNTGGPICNSKGELVGLASLQITKIKNEPGIYQGIELNGLNTIVNNTNVFKNVLGVREGGILYDEGKEFKGFYVQELVKNGSAYKAGIKPTDIILEIDDQQVIAVEDLTLLIQSKKTGDFLHCKVLSGEEIKYIDVKVHK